MRLVKYLATAGVASRRASERLIADGRVAIDGAVVTDPARDVDAADVDAADIGVDAAAHVTVDGRPVRIVAERVVYALHKPAGVVSTAADPQHRPTVVSLVRTPLRLYPVGRLDVDATGLILLTNDGELAHRLTHPSFEVDKTYRARVDRPPVSQRALRALREGVLLDDGLTAPARARRLGRDLLELTIHEGRNRQVKRMCEAVGHPVRDLERVSFGPLALGSLASGAARRLDRDEIEQLSAAGRSARRGAAASPSARRRPRPASTRSDARPRAGES